MLTSPICDLLGIDYPVFQGGMAWIADADLAAAVSNAGGLGIIAAGNAPATVVEEQIRRARTLTDKPFGVNIMLMSPYAGDIAELVVQHKVPVVTTGAGNPSKHMAAWREAGITVIPVVPSTGIAKLMQRAGAAAVVAEGGESGGHVGDLTTMALLPQVCDAVTIPVIAAGGIGDGRGMAASFMLGASGVQIGTRFLVAKECNVHPTYKQKILKAHDIDTIATGRRLGHPVRSLKTPFSRAFWDKEYDCAVSDEELEKYGEGALRLAAIDGDAQRGCFLAGQIAGMVDTEQTAAEIITEIVTQAESLLTNAPRWVK
ncbi:MAG: enoyl-[acyl-carrier-protein] reductase FabK [Propionibacteriaceae bacterium]|jgi:enoyl-[acyl-carrier protein] reductase II|nr:enoyl-[acyl-carrier-protein] reductase FabK [Propionibacteriaceae bacterium]